jgi:hypothetical protein
MERTDGTEILPFNVSIDSFRKRFDIVEFKL